MLVFASILVLFLVSLVSSAFVAARGECYNITTLATYPTSALSRNTTSVQQCQVAITNWLTTTVTITSSSANASSNSATNTLPAAKRSAVLTSGPTPTAGSPTSNLLPTTTTINPQSVLSEFASIYSVLVQYEYNITANSSKATPSNSFNISAYSTTTGTSYSNSSAADTASSPAICASSCTACTTLFYIATTTITTTTSPPLPIATLPPITVGSNTYTPTGTYYVINNSTLSPGGSAILVSNSTLVSLGPSGTQLVIAPLSPTAGGPGPSTYDLSPAPASSPPPTTPTSTSATTSTSTASQAAKVVEVALTTITGPYNLPVVVFPSEPIVIAGSTLTPGSSAVTIHETPVSLAQSSDFLVVGSSTISFSMTTLQAAVSLTSTSTTSTTTQANVGSMIWSGIGGTEPGSSPTFTTTTTSSKATATSHSATLVGQGFTGAGIAARGELGISIWTRFCLGFGIAMVGMM